MGNKSRCYYQSRTWAWWFCTCLQAGCLWGCSTAHLSWLPGNSEVHLCSLTHILAHGLAYKITLMHINSWLFNPWGRIPALPGAISVPWVAPLVQSCVLMNNSPGLGFRALLKLMK